MKLPVEYKSAFRREGVLHELSAITDQELSTKTKADASTSNAPTPEEGSGPPIPSGGLLRRSGQYIADSQDSTILRARVIRFRHLPSSSDDGAETDNDELNALKSAAKRLSAPELDLKSAKEALRTIAALFGRQDSSMSSFEMLKSGLVGELLAFASDETRYSKCSDISGDSYAEHFSAVPLRVRQRLIFEALTSRPPSVNASQPSNSSFVTVVKRLQESLTRMENFEVVTVSPSGDGAFYTGQIQPFL
jgi:E3 ubiquitin-protein ligase TRIP12